MIATYDKDGSPIPWEQWIEWAQDDNYRTIRLTRVTNAARPDESFVISTVWVGHNLGVPLLSKAVPPLLFETIVWDGIIIASVGNNDMALRRYYTREDAREGHTNLVGMVAEPMEEPLIVELWDDNKPQD